MLMQTNVSLEEELRKANAAKAQLETYKRQVCDRQPCWPQAAACNLVSDSPVSAQVVELQNKLSEESKKADKMEFEYKRVKEKVDSLQKEKEVRRHTRCGGSAPPLLDTPSWLFCTSMASKGLR